jgi:CIC family chloride channel protein
MNPKSLFTRVPKPAARWTRLFVIGALVGALGGLAAAGLDWGLHHGAKLLIGRFSHVSGPGVLHFHWGILLLPAAAGLASGLLVRLLCPEAVGHGTDVLTRAFHKGLGDLPLKGPAVKAAASVGVIACGGSAGPEGPTAALGAAIGSTCGKLFDLTPRERRIMLVAGCAAGVGAIFRCPLGGALFAASVLYREPEFEADAIVPSFVASVIAYSAFMVCHGQSEPLLEGVSRLSFSSPVELLPYLLLGPLCGLLSIFFSICLRAMEDRIVPASRLPRWLAPAFGGLATGLLACLLPQVMDGQYGFIQNALDGGPLFGAREIDWWFWARFFGAVAIFKCVATALTVGSGASGGMLGPSVFIGGAAGAALGAVCEASYPGMFPEELRKALIPVGMGGVLAAAMRTPLAAIVMVTEMTGSFGLIGPSMLVCVSAYVTGRRWGLNHEQVRSAAESPVHLGDAVVHILESLPVSRLMEKDWPETATPDETLGSLVKRITPGRRPAFAVVQNGRLLGMISVHDIQRIMNEPLLGEAVIAADIMTEQPTRLFPDEDLYQAAGKFKRGNQHVLPVVPRDGTNRWLGMLTRECVYDAVRREIKETQKLMLREHIGLAAIGQEAQLQQIVMGVSPAGTDVVQRLIVPLQAIGKSLREADFRKNFGAQVIAIEQPDGSILCPPPLDAPLRTDQRLLAILWREQVERGQQECLET